MSFQSLLHNLNNSINLSNSNSTNLRQFRNISVALRNTASNNKWLFDLLSLHNHRNKSILRWIDNSARVNQNQISLVYAINNLIPIFRELTNHKLAIRNIVRTTKGFDIDVMCSRCLLNHRLLDYLFLVILCDSKNIFLFSMLLLFLNNFLLFDNFTPILSKIK